MEQLLITVKPSKSIQVTVKLTAIAASHGLKKAILMGLSQIATRLLISIQTRRLLTTTEAMRAARRAPSMKQSRITVRPSRSGLTMLRLTTIGVLLYQEKAILLER